MSGKRMSLVAVLMLWVALPLGAQSEGSEGSGPEEGSGLHEERAQQEAVLVLKGLDPVSLVQGREEPGKDHLTAVHDGHLYRFVSPAHREAFLDNPGKYAVQNGGYCPVGKVRLNRQVKGDPEVFAVHEGRIYLFARAEAREAFLKNPGEFTRSRKMEGSGSSEEPEGSGPME